MLNFTKMNGAGNDFVMLDNRLGEFLYNRETIAHLCDRHRGVGADGLIAAEPPETADAQLKNVWQRGTLFVTFRGALTR